MNREQSHRVKQAAQGLKSRPRAKLAKRPASLALMFREQPLAQGSAAIQSPLPDSFHFTTERDKARCSCVSLLSQWQIASASSSTPDFYSRQHSRVWSFLLLGGDPFRTAGSSLSPRKAAASCSWLHVPAYSGPTEQGTGACLPHKFAGTKQGWYTSWEALQVFGFWSHIL